MRVEQKQRKLFDVSFSLFFVILNENNNEFSSISIIDIVFFLKFANSKNQIKKIKFFTITLV